MNQSYDIVNPEQGHEAIKRLWLHIKGQTQNGVRGRLVWQPLDLPYRHRLRKLFHDPILNAFAWQARVWNDEAGRYIRHAPKAWKLLLTDLFCPAQFDDDNGGIEVAKSTEALNDKEFVEFILACEAYGVTEHGVAFPEREALDAAPDRV